MKATSLLCFSLVLGGLWPAFGQVPVGATHPHSLRLEAVPTTNGNTLHKEGRTTTTTTNGALEITVHNFGTMPDSVQIEWYFVAQPVKLDLHRPASDQQFIFDKGSQNATLAANGEQKIPTVSRELTATVQGHAPVRPNQANRYEPQHEQAPTQGGDKFVGWIVRMVADGKVLDVKGSREEFEQFGRDNAKLASMTRS